jgi:hypothetical protein
MILPQTGVADLIRAVEAPRLKDLKLMARINDGAGILRIVVRMLKVFFCIYLPFSMNIRERSLLGE